MSFGLGEEARIATGLYSLREIGPAMNRIGAALERIATTLETERVEHTINIPASSDEALVESFKAWARDATNKQLKGL